MRPDTQDEEDRLAMWGAFWIALFCILCGVAFFYFR